MGTAAFGRHGLPAALRRVAALRLGLRRHRPAAFGRRGLPAALRRVAAFFRTRSLVRRPGRPGLAGRIFRGPRRLRGPCRIGIGRPDLFAGAAAYGRRRAALGAAGAGAQHGEQCRRRQSLQRGSAEPAEQTGTALNRRNVQPAAFPFNASFIRGKIRGRCFFSVMLHRLRLLSAVSFGAPIGGARRFPILTDSVLSGSLPAVHAVAVRSRFCRTRRPAPASRFDSVRSVALSGSLPAVHAAVVHPRFCRTRRPVPALHLRRALASASPPATAPPCPAVSRRTPRPNPSACRSGGSGSAGFPRVRRPYPHDAAVDPLPSASRSGFPKF